MSSRPAATQPNTAAVAATSAGGRPAGDASDYEQERVVGYDVKYQYDGRAFHARMARDPDRRGTGRSGSGRIINAHTGVGQARRITGAPDLLTI